MSLELTAAARETATRYLATFPSLTANRGAAYFAEGAVEEIRPLSSGTGFRAIVAGSQSYETLLVPHPRTGSWESSCTCPVGLHCKHAYAAMKELLADAIIKDETAPDKQSRQFAAPPLRSTLTEPLAAALGRPLTTEEDAYLTTVAVTFARVQEKRGMEIADFGPLGYSLEGYPRDRVQIWPAMPADEREFWRFITIFLEERGVEVPEFMRPLSDPGPLRQRVAEWRREREVERWKKLLSRLEDAPHQQTSAFDLRIRFAPQEAVVETRRPGESDFTPLKHAAFPTLASLPQHALRPETALLARSLAQHAASGGSPTLRYSDHEAAELLAELLRLPWLESQLVAANGEPLKRPPEPLRWELSPANDDTGDYRLCLVLPDGAPAGPFLLIVEGEPTLYVTRDAVWSGPAIDARAIDPGEEARIPAAALESGDGVRFLRRLGVELPQRVRERVRTVLLKPVVQCEIGPTWAGAKEESCVITAFGQGDDNSLQLLYTPNGWRAVFERATSADGREVHYERELLASVPAFLESLPLKWDHHRSHWHFKVTRKFAETFSAWLRTAPPDVTLDLRGELASFQNGTVAGSVRLDVDEAGLDWFDLRVVLDVADTELTKDELKLLLDARGGWVRLGAKGWRRLEFNLTGEDNEQLARLGLSAGDLASEPQRMHALQLADKAARRFLPEAQCERIERRAAELQARVTPEIPATIRAELRPYQREGFHFLAYLSTNRFGGILADDMGLGKTLQTLTWLAWLKENA